MKEHQDQAGQDKSSTGGKARRNKLGEFFSRSLFAAIVSWIVVAIIGFATTVCVLTYVNKHVASGDSTGTWLEFVKVGLTIIGGVGAVAYLVIKYRERSEKENQRLEEKLLTATNQIGNPSPQVRIAGVYALAHLASLEQGTHAQRVINILCGYLRSKREETDQAAESTVTHVMRDHLTTDSSTSWRHYGFDFHGATFTDTADFRDTTFRSSSYFRGATFQNLAGFMCATFHRNANFSNATFRSSSYFTGATFHRNAIFSNATFHRNAIFSNATFTDTADFRDTTFTDTANFNGVTFTGTQFQDVELVMPMSMYKYLSGAYYSRPDGQRRGTRFPKGFDPQEHGMILAKWNEQEDQWEFQDYAAGEWVPLP